MDVVLWTALGVGGATVIGAAIGFCFKNISHKFSDIVLAFAAGVMLAAAVMGLIVPSVEYGMVHGVGIALLMTVLGIFTGALCLNLVDRLVPHMHTPDGCPECLHKSNDKINKVMLFVLAIVASRIIGLIQHTKSLQPLRTISRSSGLNLPLSILMKRV